ncbi:MAG: TatD family nuclease-associated radical SAM protein [Firmicutes bacterium]|nr:TatD family nuclease-associated radical SAM protein [Bacillota bacterium]
MTNFTYHYQNNLYINLTNRCSNDCSFCIRSYSKGIGDDELWLSREPDVHEVIEQIETTNIMYDQIVFCGFGESTYRFDEMIKIAKFLKSIGRVVRLNTNGLGNLINNRDITKELSEVIDIVSISLNAPTPERYNEICKSIFGERAHGEIIAFAKKCVEHDIKTTLSIMDNLTEKETAKCQLIAEKIGCELKIRNMA